MNADSMQLGKSRARYFRQQLTDEVLHRTGIMLMQTNFNFSLKKEDFLPFKGDDEIPGIERHVDIDTYYNMIKQFAIKMRYRSSATDFIMRDWWEKAAITAENMNKLPLVFVKTTHQRWKFLVPLAIVNKKFDREDHRRVLNNNVAMAYDNAAHIGLRGLPNFLRGLV